MDDGRPLEALDLDEMTSWLLERDIPYEVLAGKCRASFYVACADIIY